MDYKKGENISSHIPFAKRYFWKQNPMFSVWNFDEVMIATIGPQGA